MDALRPVLTINIAAVPVRGVGGFFLCVAAIAGLFALPQGPWYLAATITLGAVLALGLIAYRARHTTTYRSIFRV